MDTLLYKASSYLNSYYTWIAFAVGSIVGSFLNVCILRIPEGTFFKKARSLCPNCKQTIPFWLNIPILSFILLRGRSHCCKKSISWQYPIVESITGIGFILIYWKFPFLYTLNEVIEISPADLIRFIHGSLFFSLLMICSVIDFHHMIIPDVISLPMIAVSPLVFYFHPELSWQSSLLGILIGGGLLYGVAWLYWLIRKQVGMGMGDVKLLAAIGGWLGYQSLLPTIFYGSIIGSTFGLIGIIFFKKYQTNSAIPFGPFLAIGAMIHLLFGLQFFNLLFSPA